MIALMRELNSCFVITRGAFRPAPVFLFGVLIVPTAGGTRSEVDHALEVAGVFAGRSDEGPDEPSVHPRDDLVDGQVEGPVARAQICVTDARRAEALARPAAGCVHQH